jgi:imidazoleglycerol-phosphate dehydratase/histidinol-phosphatase
VGELPTDMVFHFFNSIATSMGATLKVSATGTNSHHIIEIIFKCFARVLGAATEIVSDQVVSTKGVI